MEELRDAVELLVRSGLLFAPTNAPDVLFPILLPFVREQAISALDRKASAPPVPAPTTIAQILETPLKTYDSDFPPLIPRPAPAIAPSTSSGPKRVAPTKVHALCTKPEELVVLSKHAHALTSLASLYAGLFFGRYLPSFVTEIVIVLRMLSIPLEYKRDPLPPSPAARLFSDGYDYVLWASLVLDHLAPIIVAHGSRIARLCSESVPISRYCKTLHAMLAAQRANKSPRVAPLGGAQKPEPNVTHGIEASAEVRRGRVQEEQAVLSNREKCRDAFLDLLQQMSLTRELSQEAVRATLQTVVPDNWPWLADFLVVHALTTDEADAYLLQLAGGAERLQRLNQRMSATKPKGAEKLSTALPEQLHEQRLRLLLAVADVSPNTALYSLMLRSVVTKLNALLVFQSQGQLMHALTERVLQLRCLGYALGALLVLPFRLAFPHPDSALHANALTEALNADEQLPPIWPAIDVLRTARSTGSVCLVIGCIGALSRAMAEHPIGRRMPLFKRLVQQCIKLLSSLPPAQSTEFAPVDLLVLLEIERFLQVSQLDPLSLPSLEPDSFDHELRSDSERILQQARLDKSEFVDGRFLELCCPAVESLSALLIRLNERSVQMSGQKSTLDPLRFSDGLTSLARRKVTPQSSASIGTGTAYTALTESTERSAFQHQLRNAFFAQHPELSRLADFALQASVAAALAEALETLMPSHEERLVHCAAQLPSEKHEALITGTETDALSAVTSRARAQAAEKIRVSVVALMPHGLDAMLTALTCSLAIEHATALIRERAAETCAKRLRAALQDQLRRNAKLSAGSPSKPQLRSPKVAPPASANATLPTLPEVPLRQLSVPCTSADVVTFTLQFDALLNLASSPVTPNLPTLAQALSAALLLLCTDPAPGSTLSMDLTPLLALLHRMALIDVRLFASLPSALLQPSKSPGSAWRERVSSVLCVLVDIDFDSTLIEVPLVRLSVAARASPDLAHAEDVAADMLVNAAQRHLKLANPLPFAFSSALAHFASSSRAHCRDLALATLRQCISESAVKQCSE